MTEAISLPSNWTFQEMLSHTFPGFFSAFSVFMLMDYFSPYDLTNWAITDVSNLIAFAGFIFIMGTILGVIIDAIHHTFIEDDIFDNYKSIQDIKIPINNRLSNLCSEFGENFTRHAFFAKMGTNGDKAQAFDEYLDKAYYRYSEFYSNIFVSLVLFSLICPFYTFKTLNIPWKLSVSIGVASLVIACLCLASSYTTYKQYLQAQCSLICGLALNADKKCELKCKIKYRLSQTNIDKSKIEQEVIEALDGLLMSSKEIEEIADCLTEKPDRAKIILKNLAEVTKSESDKNILNKLINKVDNENKQKLESLEKLKNVKANTQKIEALKNTLNKILKEDTKGKTDQFRDTIQFIQHTISFVGDLLSRGSRYVMYLFLILLFIFMSYLGICYSPVSLSIEPAGLSFAENLTNNNESSFTYPSDTVILKNLGKELNLSFEINGIKDEWFVIKDNNISINTLSILPGETKYLRVGLISRRVLNDSALPGTYVGSIRFFEKGDDSDKNQGWEIPIKINLTKS